MDQDNGGWNINFLAFGLNTSGGGGSPPPPGEAPYGGTAAAVPGTVQAENYDTGGQGVAYNVTSVNGSANSYRSDGVDLEATTDTGGGYDLGWTAAGQWFKYTVNVATAGTYTVGLRLAAPTAVTDALHIDNSAGTNLSGNVTAPATGGYQTWTTVTVTVTLPAGTQTLTVDQDNAGWNINYLAFATSGGGGTGGTYGGFPAGFWGNTSSIPSTSGAIEFDFINATNGQYPNSEVYWSVNGVTESIAQSPYYSMASCNSCRVYFYLGSTTSQYNDFIELNSSGTTINADTSRVDAFGLPLAIHLHNSDGSDTVVGEDDQVFSESRTALFTQFENYVPAAFKQLATVDAPYNIPSPTDVAAFQPGGADAELHDLVRGLAGRHRDHAAGLRVPGRRQPGPQRQREPVRGAEPLRGAVLDDGAEHAVRLLPERPVQLLLRVLALGRRQRPCVRLRLRRRQRPVLRLQQHRRAVRASSNRLLTQAPDAPWRQYARHGARPGPLRLSRPSEEEQSQRRP